MRPLLTHQTPPPSPAMKSHSPSSTTVARKRLQTPSKEALNPSFADLPSSLLEVIMSCLVLKDNIRASVACKSWCEAAVCVRVVEKHPWLLCFPKSGFLFKLCDPLQWKSYTLNLPELAGSTVCYSRDGWLLVRKSIANDNTIFFFNPFSRDIIRLPKFELPFKEIAFSCPPTSDHCVVIALDFDERIPQRGITTSTCHPLATEWITEVFPSRLPFFFQTLLVYHNDRFYCFTSGRGGLYSFHPSSRIWKYHGIASRYLSMSVYPKATFLAEKKGELFLMVTCENEKPVVYKLVSFKWEEMGPIDLDGLTFFVSFYNSVLRTDLPWMRNNVYFSRYGYNRKSCVSYSFDESKYNPPKGWHNWHELCSRQSLWIDPPENDLNFVRAMHEE